MVQRKAPNKLELQAADHHHVKSDKLLAKNLKATSYHQHQDGKNRGPEMKKKMMKKSRSIKLSDIESLRSSTLKKNNISQPGKPPPSLPSIPAAMMTTATSTPQKQQSVMRTAEGSPNYMKSTSSSEARKENSQVSSRNTPIGSDSKNPGRRNSRSAKISSGSSYKPARSLTRSSSLKLVRALTKTPSFKHVRAQSKKCSRVVICAADMNAQRATCSSTLKDTKSPAYLSLSPGATEAEGTSAVKVCPYTYCSLNGHHHTPLPPLKCFLLARRRTLKMQKSMKLEALSPRRVKPVGEEVDAGEVIFVDEPAYKEDGFVCSPRSALIKGGGMDFFIEIYAKNKEGKGESSLGGCDGAAVEHNNEKQVAVSLSDGSPHSEIDFEESVEQYADIVSMGVDIREGFPEKQKVEDADKDYLPIVDQNEAAPERFYNGSEFEEDSSASTEGNDSSSEGTDMEWEEGQYSSLEPDAEANCSVKIDDESDLDVGYLSEINNIKSESIVIDHMEVLANEEFEEESASFNTQGKESDAEMDDRHQNLESDVFKRVSDSSNHDQQLSTEEAEMDFIGVMVASATVEPVAEPIASREEVQENSRVPEAENEIPETSLKLGDVGMYSDTFQNVDETDKAVAETDKNVGISDSYVVQELSNSEAGVQTEEKERDVVTKRSIGVQFPEIEVDEEQVAVTKVSVGIQVPDFSGSFYEEHQDDAEVDVNQHPEMTAVPCQVKDLVEDSNLSQDIADETLPDENQEDSSENQNDNVADDQNEDKKFKIQSSMDSEEQIDSNKNILNLAETETREVEKMEMDESSQQETTETFPMTSSINIPEPERTTSLVESKSDPELPVTCSKHKWKIGSKRTFNDEEEPRKFNPRDPNFLPEVPEPDPEKVDLKHQMMDERKNSEEWMVDYALRQTVTKLAPARKKKVALLVEAFETITPVPKYKSHLKHSSASFAPARPIQACS